MSFYSLFKVDNQLEIDAYINRLQALFPGFETQVRQNGLLCAVVVSKKNRDSKVSFYTEKSSGIWVICHAELGNVEDLKTRLNLPKTAMTGEILAAGYLHWGNESPIFLDGLYSISIFDPRQNLFWGVRDRVGIFPLYFGKTACIKGLSSHPVLLSHTRDSLSVNNEYLSHSVLELYCKGTRPFWGTLFNEIMACPHAHFLCWEDTQLHVKSYWEFDDIGDLDIPTTFSGVTDVFDRLLNKAFQKALRVQLGTDQKVGIELSGGLDSSTLSFHLKSCLSADQVYPVTIQNRDKNETESEYHDALKLSHKLGWKLKSFAEDEYEILLDKDMICDQVTSHMIGDLFWFFHFPFYGYLAQNGVTCLVSGYGGDYFVSSKAVFRLDELKKRSFFIYLFEWLLSWREGPWDRLKSFVTRKIGRHNDKLLKEKKSSFPEVWKSWIFLQSIDPRFNSLQEIESAYFSGIYANGIQQRLACSYLAAGYFGVTYLFPLLDWELIHFYHHLPSKFKRRFGQGRCLLRHNARPFYRLYSLKVPGKKLWTRSPFWNGIDKCFLEGRNLRHKLCALSETFFS